MARAKFAAALHAAFDRTAGADNVQRALALIEAEQHASDDMARSMALKSARARARTDAAYNPHRTHTLVLEALDEYLGTCGDEYLGEVHTHSGPPVEYLNVGDPYAPTLVWYRDRYRGQHYHVHGWADALEVCERRGDIRRDAAE